MRPEIEIILLALRGDLDGDVATRFTQFLAQDIDWHFLSIAAIGHKVCPPLDFLLEKHGVDHNLTGLIRQESNEIQRKSLMLTARLFKLQTILLESGIEFVFVKGIVISDLLYGTVKRRAFSDIDIFVKSKDVPGLAQILEHEGFHPTPMWCRCDHPSQFFSSPTFLKLGYEKEYASSNNSFAVDLHWGPGTWFATCDQMLKHTAMQDIAGHTVRTLEPNLHFVYLCAHAAKHDWDTLIWISDFARALQSENIFNWRKVARLSRKMGLFGTVQTSVSLAHKLLGAEIPNELLPLDPMLEKVAFQIIGRYDRTVPPVVSFSKVPHWRRIWRTYDTKMQVAKQVASDLFKPTFSDWVRINLPDNLFWLYYLTRPASKVYFFSRNILRNILFKKLAPARQNSDTECGASTKDHQTSEQR
ncbi:MAG: nucleotidyltransferase family protein [Candidatus Melainabacteria bacterium]|nr:nucleotidyltransferase family protein [Candidatus Melainabacteria bacterium]